MPSPGVSTDRLADALGPVVADLGADLEGVEVSAAGRRRRVRVIVDADGGVDLDAVAAISQAVSRALDDGSLMGEQSYVLEVTSPGVDRPLTLPRHWRRNVGRLVRITRRDGGSVEGRLVAAAEDHATLDTGVTVRFDDVARAVVEVDFTRPEA